MRFLYLPLFILFSIAQLDVSVATFTSPSKPSNAIGMNIPDENKTDIASSIRITSNSTSITRWEAFVAIGNSISSNIPNSYKYIDLQIIWSTKWSPEYKALQKLVYIWVLPNKKALIDMKKTISAYNFYALASRALKVKLIKNSQYESLKGRNASNKDILLLNQSLQWKKVHTTTTREITTINFPESNTSTSWDVARQQEIFMNVYKTLLSSHYDRSTLDQVDLITWATEWLAKWTGDKFTTYFPPVSNKNFMQSLEWKFEWIWSYIEMEEPWILRIISPISWSPSDRAWLKWWDIVSHVDWKEILKTTSLTEAVSWIKWPKWSGVKLSILRWWKKLQITVIRDVIVIKNVDHEKIWNDTYYIQITTFGESVYNDFSKAVIELKKQKWIKKVIIDLRNNPGWFLDQASKILSHFVPEWEATVQVDYISWAEKLTSFGYTDIDFWEYELIILQNSWSASASEIMAWTIKDYLPKTTIIWEKSYGKGSVQTIKQYGDGSSLKYTIAKWFTWKTKTGIDGVWISADIVIEYDFDMFKETWVDNQLERAKRY